MPLPKLKFRALAAPSRQVLLLPDDRFFIRTVSLVSGPEAADVISQIELALEALAPFPIAQLYYGYWTRPGADRAIVFAAYRKRFAAEDVEAWAGADLVAPRFALLLGAEPPPAATTWVFPTDEGLTAVHFGDASGVPTAVRSIVFLETDDSTARLAARERLIRELGGSRVLVEVSTVDVEPSEPGDGDYEATGGPVESELTVAQAEMLDVRDREELTARRRGRARDRWLWRGLLAALWVIGACALAELSIVAMRAWQSRRLEQVAQQTPRVAEIMTAHALATRIEELSTRRLRPMEMIDLVDRPRPESIQFLTTTTNGLYTLEVQAQTQSIAEIDTYQTALRQLPEVADAQVEVQRTQNNLTTFRLIVQFSPTAFTAPVEAASS